MQGFLEKFRERISGVLSGFDRLLFRGTLRAIADARGMQGFLYGRSVLLKDFAEFVESTTQQVRAASLAAAEGLGREVRYLESSQLRKEDVAREIAARDGITQGLIGVLTAVEPCRTFQVIRNRQTKRLELRAREAKCLHLYHYFQHSRFGFMHARLQTWFPFSVQVCLNGREMLRVDLLRENIAAQRFRNTFTSVADVAAAQALLDRQLELPWATLLNEILDQVHPLHRKLFPEEVAGAMGQYYWSAHQSEWATDVMFHSREDLQAVYPRLVRHSILAHDGGHVLRFLGKKTRQDGSPRADFCGEVVSDVATRSEGTRIRHQLNRNSVKMYDKESVLRFETTINDPRDFSVYRTLEGQPDSPPAWYRMRKGIADLHRRAQVSQASNARFMEAQAATQERTALLDLACSLCRPVVQPGRRRSDGTTAAARRHRALNPFSPHDHELLRAVTRAEFSINGFRNRDLCVILFRTVVRNPAERRRRSSAVTRRLALLRAHGLIKKVPKTHRYQLTDSGRKALTALIAAASASVDQLTQAAA